MKGAPSQQGGSGGGYGGMPAWLGMASQYFPQYFGGDAGQTPQTGPQGGAPGAASPAYPTYTGPPRDQPLAAPPGPPAPPPVTGGPEPPPISAPPNPATPPMAGQTAGLLGGGLMAGAATPNDTTRPYGLLSGAPPQQSGWMPGYGGSRGAYGSGGQPGTGYMPPQQQSATGYMPPQGGLFGPFAQY